jgi:transcription antitermination factor NusG
MSYWTVARLEPRREQLALRCLGLAGYATYFPRLREHRISHGRRIEIRPPLFPGYCFLTVEARWYAARWSIGVIGLIMDGVRPARVADQIIDDLRKRERNGLIELPSVTSLNRGASSTRCCPPSNASKTSTRSCDQVRILQGPFAGHPGLYAGVRAKDDVGGCRGSPRLAPPRRYHDRPDSA